MFAVAITGLATAKNVLDGAAPRDNARLAMADVEGVYGSLLIGVAGSGVNFEEPHILYMQLRVSEAR